MNKMKELWDGVDKTNMGHVVRATYDRKPMEATMVDTGGWTVDGTGKWPEYDETYIPGVQTYALNDKGEEQKSINYPINTDSTLYCNEGMGIIEILENGQQLYMAQGSFMNGVWGYADL